MAKKKLIFQDGRLFTLDVCLFEGMISKEFAKKNKVISRTIEIRGSQTLEELHECIFDAFDRDDPHMYEFQFGGKGPRDRKAKRYVLPEMMEDGFGAEYDGDLTKTAVGELGLKIDDIFAYWFDYGDDWWHQINVVAIADTVTTGKYPRVTKRIGESPPQYTYDDEDEEDIDDEECGDEEIVFDLSQPQRDLLLSIKDQVLDDDIIRLISIAAIKGKKYEFTFTYEQLDRLIDWACSVSNMTTDSALQKKIDRLIDSLERIQDDAV